jgi:hypothetical protein
MAAPREPEPVKLFVGMLSAFPETFEAVAAPLAEAFGPVDLRSDVWPHEFTDYYEGEMGGPLKRAFVAFEQLIDPGTLAEVKLRTNEIERDLAGRGRWPVARPVNLDPGYVTPAKLVLASCKDYTHRVYLGRGVYAEPTLAYAKGRWRDYEWTYPDYRAAEYHAFFDRLRAQLTDRLREARDG